MKQETIEEAVEKYQMENGNAYSMGLDDAFYDGAKWQQEKIYNEIKKLHDSEDITGFSKLAYAKCLDIIKNK